MAVWTIFVILNFSLQVLAMKIFSKNFKNCKTNRERIDYCWIVNSDVLAVISSVISFSEWIDNASSDFWCSRLTGLLLPPLLSESPFSVLFCRMLLKIDSLSFWQKKINFYLFTLRGPLPLERYWWRLRPFCEYRRFWLL